MAVTNNDYFAPCLLDDLMDNNVIKCDIALGSPLHFDVDLDTDFGDSTKASPSHESDSGCSDMSEEIRSVNCDDALINFDLFECDSTEQDLDKEIEMYFASPVTRSKGKQAIHEESGVLHTPVNVDDMLSDQEEEHESSSDEEYIPPKLQKSQPVVVHNKGKEKTCVIQKSGCLQPVKSNSANSIVPKPAVKVVKVIKTPAASKCDIDNSIMQALDERNKKNAIQAKLNREKKKAYIKSLEDEIDSLKDENVALKESNKKTSREKKALELEVEYLRSVLANDSALSGLLKNINHPKDVKLSSRFRHKRSADLDHDYRGSKKVKVGAGVCLHVDQENVSLEFCSKCSNMACSTFEES